MSRQLPCWDGVQRKAIDHAETPVTEHRLAVTGQAGVLQVRTLASQAGNPRGDDQEALLLGGVGLVQHRAHIHDV